MIWFLVIAYSIYIWSFLPIIYIILPTYIGKPIWFAVNVTQHLAAKIDTIDHRLSTYSVRINPILSFLYWHMEYHLEHHMFPMVPSYNLKKLREEVDDQLPKPLRKWLTEAILPWSTVSVRRVWCKSIRKGLSFEEALNVLDKSEKNTMKKQRSKIKNKKFK